MRKSGAVFAFLVVVCMTLSSVAAAEDVSDTRENRLAAAERYLNVVPMDMLFDNMLDQIIKSGQIPIEAKRLQAEFRGRLDVAKIEAAVIRSLAKNFTTREIDAMSDFYGSPEGLSVMKKFGAYYVDVMPTVQQEAARVIGEIRSDVNRSRNSKGAVH